MSDQTQTPEATTDLATNEAHTEEAAPAIAKTVALGHIVRDRISGMQGVAVQKVELLNGTIQFAIQPKISPGDPGKMPEGWNIDYHLLEYVDDGIADKVTPPAPTHVGLGDDVKDTISGIRGITTSKTVFINGCTYFSVQPETKDKKATAPAKTIFVSHTQLVVKKHGAFVNQAPDHEPQVNIHDDVVEPKRPGGPMSRMTRV